MTPPPSARPFLERVGWGGAAVRPLAGDASFRRYFRVIEGVRSAVLMDAPPPHEDVRPFLAIAVHLDALGLAVPRALAADEDAGLVLLDDLGDDRLTTLLARRPALEQPLYEVAVDILAALARHAPPAGLRAYDEAEYLREARLFTEWYCPAVGLNVDNAAFDDAWRTVLKPVLAQPLSVLVLRDYHADNLMHLPQRGKLQQLGLLDFQDALAGHPAYDLVSLLEDARRDVPDWLQRRMLARYVDAVDIDPQPFEAAYAILGAQRNTKILGIFTRLWQRDGKPNYLAFQPRVWAHLERDLKHPALHPVRAWFRANVPAHARAGRWAAAA
ncbi:MAG: phosphotransferase [Sphingomonadaceae bacterium]|nr:phosphotransferase [Sphingomonadaceae bacterium]